MKAHPGTQLLFELFRGKKAKVAESIALSCVQSFALLPVALLVNTIIDKAIPGQNVHMLLLTSLEMVLLILISGMVQLLNRRVSVDLVKAGIAELRCRLIQVQLEGTRKYYSKEDVETLHSRIVQDTFRVDSMLSALLGQTIPGLLVSVGLFFVLLKLNLTLSIFSLLLFPAFAAMVFAMGRRLKTLIKAFHKDFSQYSKGIQFALGNNELIRISTAETFELKRQTKYIEDLRVSHASALMFSSLLQVSQRELLMLSGAGILLIGGFFVTKNLLTLGELIAFYAALGMLNSNVRAVIESVSSLVEGFESLRVLGSIMEEVWKETKPAGAIEHQIGRSIVFERVSFTYSGSAPPEDSKPLIENLDFSIDLDADEIVNIHGLSGSGKSTLMYLLLGYYQPDSGRILVDGIDLRELSMPQYRRQIGVVFQDPLIFAGTIRENLTYGLLACDQDEIEKACADAMILEDIHFFGEGFETLIGESGMTLSGGQRQRLAIARALLRKPRLLILDEPTNHLDESLIEAISRLWGRQKDGGRLGRACIVISHDKILRNLADSSYVMKGGKMEKEHRNS